MLATWFRAQRVEPINKEAENKSDFKPWVIGTEERPAIRSFEFPEGSAIPDIEHHL